MPTYKTTLFVEAAGGGFSETMYQTVADVVTATKRLLAYLPFRLRVLSSGDADGGVGRVVGYRLQNVALPTDFHAAEIDRAGTFKPADAPSGADMPWTGIVCQFISSGGRRRSFTLRGIPDSAVKNTYRGVNFSPDFGSAMTAWKKAVFDQDFQLQIIDKANDALLKTILSLQVGGLGLGVTTTGPHGFVTGDVVRFFQVHSQPTLKGQHRIIVTANDAFTIPTINIGDVGFDDGKVRKIVYDYEDIEVINLIRKGSRKAGRPFFLLRGRR